MEKFLNWFNQHRKSIGYTVGILNILNGLLFLSSSYFLEGILWLVLGTAIVFDAKYFK